MMPSRATTTCTATYAASVDDFVAAWWPQVDPREALLWLADTELAYEVCRSVLSQGDAAALSHAARETLELGSWTVSDVALVDELSVRVGQVEAPEVEERSFYEIEELDGVEELQAMGSAIRAPEVDHSLTPTSARERLLHGTVGRSTDYAHVLVDEAQDLSPMQWRMVGRRGRYASWTVVGDAAQHQVAAGDPQPERWVDLGQRLGRHSARP